MDNQCCIFGRLRVRALAPDEAPGVKVAFRIFYLFALGLKTKFRIVKIMQNATKSVPKAKTLYRYQKSKIRTLFPILLKLLKRGEKKCDFCLSSQEDGNLLKPVTCTVYVVFTWWSAGRRCSLAGVCPADPGSCCPTQRWSRCLTLLP